MLTGFSITVADQSDTNIISRALLHQALLCRPKLSHINIYQELECLTRQVRWYAFLNIRLQAVITGYRDDYMRRIQLNNP